MKRPSLVYQAKEILSLQFNQGFGNSKHQGKQSGKIQDTIYSRSTYNNTLEKCCTYLNYCKQNFAIRYLNELKPEYFTQFIKSGNNELGYSKETAITYKSALQKLQNGYNSQNNQNCNWIDELYKKDISGSGEKRKKQMPKAIHDKIITNAYQGKYENGLAFDIARALGLRVSEITNLRMKDFIFNFKNKLLGVYIHSSKGGRSRTIQADFLMKEQIHTVLKIYRHFKNIRNKNERLFINKSSSYQRAFERIREKVSNDYKYCGVHSMRKEFAKDYYTRETAKGRKGKAVKNTLTKLLGHNRLDILKYYLKRSA